MLGGKHSNLMQATEVNVKLSYRALECAVDEAVTAGALESLNVLGGTWRHLH